MGDRNYAAWVEDDTPHCPNCWKPYPDFAHGVLEAVAITLAEPLRKALRVHWDTCPHCSTGKALFNCPEGRRLYELQAPFDNTVILG
jgi:hypothetical protein